MAVDNNDVESRQETFAKYKRVPPSQIERDRVRSQQWNNSSQTNELKSLNPLVENNSTVPFDGTIPKQTTAVPPSKSNTHSNTKANQQAGSSVTTRSRSRLNSAAEPFIPSPVPQVDGTTDRQCEDTTLGSHNLEAEDCEILDSIDWKQFLNQPNIKKLFLPDCCKEYAYMIEDDYEGGG